MKKTLILTLSLLQFPLLFVSCNKESNLESTDQKTAQASAKGPVYPAHQDIETFLQQHVSQKSEGILVYSSSHKTDGRSRDDSSYTMYVTVDCMATDGCAMNGKFEAMKWKDDPNTFSSPDPSMYPVILKMGQHVVTELAIDLEKRESGWTVTNIKVIR